jgi:hypothetical protein
VPERWPAVVSLIADTFRAPRTLLFTLAHTPAQGGFTFTHNISQAALEQWAAKSMHEDPYVRSAMARGLLVEGVAVNMAHHGEIFGSGCRCRPHLPARRQHDRDRPTNDGP